MDEIFGATNFVHEIIWKNKYGPGAFTRGIGNVHEYIICYSKRPLLNVAAPLSEDEIKIILKSKYAVNEDKATVIAKLSGGSMKRAISFLDDDNFNLCQNAMDFLSKDLNAKDIWQISDEFSAMDKAKIKQWADFLQMIIRDLLLLQAGADDNLLYNRDKKDVLDKLIVNFSLNRLFNCQNLIENLVKRLSSNADLKLMMQDFMLSWREQK